MNRLAKEKSPYLLQHKTNPVDWYPWGEEAFAEARRLQKPVFLSIGYSTCHWCHVMEHESFEDSTVAQAMNRAFVNIKVDREERPDIDHIYMSVCQMMTGSGGWPLTIIMTPDQKPFFAGTYFPKENRHGRIGMLELVSRVEDAWKTQRPQIDQTVAEIITALSETSTSTKSNGLDESVLRAVLESMKRNFDAEWGGFGSAPKFPSPHNLMLLLRLSRRFDDQEAVAMVEKTLLQMREGGMFDHVGYGFHRYSVDRQWMVPHFEKMLYDQAMLAMASLECFQATHKPVFARIAREIFEYVERDLLNPVGAFDSAEDADSEGVEGKFYVWNFSELEANLSKEELSQVEKFWGARRQGNFSDMGHASPDNILHGNQDLPEVRKKLFALRSQRVRPHKDDKVLTDWNGLMIAAIAKGSIVLKEPQLLQCAMRAYEFFETKMIDGQGRVLHRFRDGETGILGYLDDYVFQAWAALELYQASQAPKYLRASIDLMEKACEEFASPDGGLFFTGKSAESLILRKKEIYDGATPTGNSVAYWLMQRLAKLTGDISWENRAQDMARCFSAEILLHPPAHNMFLIGTDLALSKGQEIVTVASAEESRRAAEEFNQHFLPQCEFLFKCDDDISKLAPYTRSMVIGPQPRYFVCQNFACSQPTEDKNKVIELALALTAKK